VHSTEDAAVAAVVDGLEIYGSLAVRRPARTVHPHIPCSTYVLYVQHVLYVLPVPYNTSRTPRTGQSSAGDDYAMR